MITLLDRRGRIESSGLVGTPLPQTVMTITLTMAADPKRAALITWADPIPVLHQTIQWHSGCPQFVWQPPGGKSITAEGNSGTEHVLLRVHTRNV